MKRNEIIGEISNRTLNQYRQGAHTQVQGAKFGKGKGTPEAEKTIAKREKGMARAGEKQIAIRKAANDKAAAAENQRLKDKYAGVDIDAEIEKLKPAVARAYNDYQYGARNTWSQGRDDYHSLSARVKELERAKKALGEQSVEEVSKGTLDRYVTKAVDAHGHADAAARMSKNDPDKRSYHVDQKRTAEKRRQGIGRAMDRMAKNESILEGYSDYVGNAIEDLRMSNPGLEQEDFLDELYSYIDAEYGKEAADRAFADESSYDDWYENYSDLEETTGMLKVAKDDDKQTILQNPTTGVQTQIDKTNPNAPRLAQGENGKLALQMPQASGLGADKAPNLVGKEVQVDQMPEMVDIRRLAGL